MHHGLGYYLTHIVSEWEKYLTGMNTVDFIWLAVGLLGQSMFMMRFIVQWLHSEKHKKSVIPESFWYLSLIGGLIILAYGIHRVEPIIILGQIPGTFVYIRNLMFIHRDKKKYSNVI